MFVADFGEPTEEDRFSDLDYYVEGLVRRCVRKVLALTGQPNLNLVGYCLGGTLSLLYAALHPTSVARLVLLTAMVDGDVKGGIAWVAHRMGLAGESYDNPRLVPAAEVKSWFEMLAPGSNSQVGRVQDLVGSAGRFRGTAARRPDDGVVGGRRGAGTRAPAGGVVPAVRSGA